MAAATLARGAGDIERMSVDLGGRVESFLNVLRATDAA
jgi:hypothetical protein